MTASTQTLPMNGRRSARRIAMVGAGYFAPFQLEGWRDAGCPVAAICDLQEERSHEMARRFDVPKVHKDAAAMLDSGDVDLVDIVLPPSAQAAVVRAALERRIPVICQKPFCSDWTEALALTEFAKQQATTLVIHENFRFSPWYREARRLIEDGRLGELHGISFRLRPGDGQGPAAYLDRQPYFQTMPRLLMRETGVHFIDTFRYLMGEVSAVTARLRKVNPKIAGEDAGLVIFEFDTGGSGLFDGNRLNDHVAQNPRRTMGEMWLEGSAGVLRLDGDARLWWKPHRGTEVEHGYANAADAAFGGACCALQAHVLAHLDQGAPLENAARDYLENLRVQDAVYHSHDVGRRVEMATFDPSSTPSRKDHHA